MATAPSAPSRSKRTAIFSRLDRRSTTPAASSSLDTFLNTSTVGYAAPRPRRGTAGLISARDSSYIMKTSPMGLRRSTGWVDRTSRRSLYLGVALRFLEPEPSSLDDESLDDEPSSLDDESLDDELSSLDDE